MTSHPSRGASALLLLLLLGLWCGGAAAGRVLMVLPLGSPSHKTMLTPLAEALVHQGHQVTVASLHDTNGNASVGYQDLVASRAWNIVKKVTGDFDVFRLREEAGGGDQVNAQVMKKVLRHMSEYCDAFLRDPGLAEAWETRPDLILLPAFMNECGLAWVQRFKAPFVYVTTSGLTPWTADLLGNPEHPAYVPNQYLPYTDDMTLMQRTANTLAR